MVKKTDLARQAFAAGNVKEALRIAKAFRLGLSREEQDTLIRAYECMVHPYFYRALGKDPEAEIERGLEVFRRRIAGGVSVG